MVALPAEFSGSIWEDGMLAHTSVGTGSLLITDKLWYATGKKKSTMRHLQVLIGRVADEAESSTKGRRPGGLGKPLVNPR